MDTLRLFVIVNSLVMFMTVAWPQIKKFYVILQEYMFETEIAE